MKFLRILFLIIDVLAGAAMTVSAYSGMISPLKHGGVWGIVGLMFPILLGLVVFLALIQLFWNKLGSLFLAVFMVFSGGPIITYCPLNIGSRSAQDDAFTFTLLEYNVANFDDQRPEEERPQDSNAILTYIINTNADIVCLSEATIFVPNERNHINQAQIDSLHALYPYIMVYKGAQMTFSRFPLEPIHLDITGDGYNNVNVGAYRVTLPDGRLFTLVNAHLQSIGLQMSDKDLYLDLTEMKPSDFDIIKAQLLTKLAYANVLRARQVQCILQMVRHSGGPNVIVCGDFNDIQDSYAIRSFEDAGFHSVYPEVGFGPMITFNANRFYFCIDHILYRGDFRPLWLRKGTTKASDHYPLLTEFELISTAD